MQQTNTSVQCDRCFRIFNSYNNLISHRKNRKDYCCLCNESVPSHMSRHLGSMQHKSLQDQTQHFICLGIPRDQFAKGTRTTSHSTSYCSPTDPLPNDSMTIDGNTETMEEDTIQNLSAEINSNNNNNNNNINLPSATDIGSPNVSNELIDKINRQKKDYRSVTLKENYDEWAEGLVKRDKLNTSDVPLIVPDSAKKSGGENMSEEVRLLLNWMSDSKPSNGSVKNLLTRLKNCKNFDVTKLPESFTRLKTLSVKNLKTTTFHKRKSKGIEYEYRDVFESIAFLVERYGDRMKWQCEENNGIIKGPMNSKGVLEYQKKKMALEKVIPTHFKRK